eukprot:scpid83250/ scgid8931/ 
MQASFCCSHTLTLVCNVMCETRTPIIESNCDACRPSIGSELSCICPTARFKSPSRCIPTVPWLPYCASSPRRVQRLTISSLTISYIHIECVGRRQWTTLYECFAVNTQHTNVTRRQLRCWQPALLDFYQDTGVGQPRLIRAVKLFAIFICSNSVSLRFETAFYDWRMKSTYSQNCCFLTFTSGHPPAMHVTTSACCVVSASPFRMALLLFLADFCSSLDLLLL